MFQVERSGGSRATLSNINSVSTLNRPDLLPCAHIGKHTHIRTNAKTHKRCMCTTTVIHTRTSLCFCAGSGRHRVFWLQPKSSLGQLNAYSGCHYIACKRPHLHTHKHVYGTHTHTEHTHPCMSISVFITNRTHHPAPNPDHRNEPQPIPQPWQTHKLLT